ncbi:MAG: alpha/beta hydrolase [Rhizobiaceae bacterium]|nr:alpha/beta hydrolase [Rhizobiaceae bacterium]
MYFAQRSMLFPGATMGAGPVPDPPPWGERVEIATADGEQIEALFTSADTGRPTAIFFHGNADTVLNYGFMASALAQRGIGLLAISYRGYGGSSGSPSEAGLIADGLAAFDWLTVRHDGPVVLVGQSLGSAVAVAVATERQAAGIALISAPDSMLALARTHYPYLPVGPLIRDPFRSDLRIAEVDEPKLFLHGDKDTIVPLMHGQALFELAPEPKEMPVLPGTGHNDLWSLDTVDMVADFIDSVGQVAN